MLLFLSLHNPEDASFGIIWLQLHQCGLESSKEVCIYIYMRPRLSQQALCLYKYANTPWYPTQTQPLGIFSSRFWTALGSPVRPETMGDETVLPGNDQAAEVWRRALEKVVPACVVLR